jgi:hypothetical protein
MCNIAVIETRNGALQMLDLRHILLADHQVAKFATKREALALAQARGWNTCDVMQAYNRFNIFWVVGDRTSELLRLATRQPGTVFLPFAKAA